MKFPILSFTMLADAENCPHKFYRKHVARDLPYEKPTPALATGRAAHTAMEARIKKGVALDPEWRSAEPYCAILDKLPDTVRVEAEYKIAMKIDGAPCAWDAGDAWLRTKADLAVWTRDGGWLVDWKTGKVREQPFELEVQGLLMQANHGDTTTWEGEYFWFQEKRGGNRYTLKPADTFQRVGRIYGEMKQCFDFSDPPYAFPKHQNPLCGWCPVRDCEYNTCST